MKQHEIEKVLGTGASFLDAFVGTWIGEGTSDNYKVRDQMSFQRVLNNYFLHFRYSALDGDDYKGEGYVFFSENNKRFEWYEFNNGRWPIKILIGTQENFKLVLEEHLPERELRLVFEFLDRNTIHMTEAYINEKQNKVFVDEIFKRDKT